MKEDLKDLALEPLDALMEAAVDAIIIIDEHGLIQRFNPAAEAMFGYAESEVRGRNLVTGLPETIEVSSVEMREALSGSVQVVVDTIRDALDEIPPEIVADLMDIGICLAGGGGLLQGLADRLSDELKLRVWVAEDPLTCVARGAGMIFDDFDILSRYLVGLERGSTHHNA